MLECWCQPIRLLYLWSSKQVTGYVIADVSMLLHCAKINIPLQQFVSLQYDQTLPFFFKKGVICETICNSLDPRPFWLLAA